MITKKILKQIAPNANDKIISDLELYLDEYLRKYNVNTWLRICHFLAQAAHESAGFRTLEEYASGAAYEGRRDLGNIKAGDGVRYKGRGIFQLTGRANYKTYGEKIGYNLEYDPKLAADPKISVLTALEYWNSKSLSTAADRDDVETITRRINGGLNGFEDRKKYLERAKKIIPKDIKLGVEDRPLPPPPVNPIIPPIVVAKKGDNSPYVADLQNMLIKKGASITADGAFGPKTEQAVKDFQTKNGLPVTGSIDTDTLNKLMV
jgi:putative chitinase